MNPSAAISARLKFASYESALAATENDVIEEVDLGVVRVFVTENENGETIVVLLNAMDSDKSLLVTV